ncbi:unnamed protein product [Alopecurus aequalis]
MTKGKGGRNRVPPARAAAANANPPRQGRKRAQPVVEESVEESVAAPEVTGAAAPPPPAQWQELMQELHRLREQAQARAPAPAPAIVQGMMNEPVGPRQVNPLLTWSMVHSDTFNGTGSPVVAADWLRIMERHLEVMQVQPDQKVMFAAIQLKGNADIWWENVRSSLPPAHATPTWEFFRTQFIEKYYPASYVERMENALSKLKQGNRTIQGYETEFNDIVRFVLTVVNDDKEKARRFKDGLEQQYRVVLSAAGSSTFASLVEKAKKIEFELQNGSPHLVTPSPQGGPTNFSTAGGNQKRDHSDGGKPHHRFEKKSKTMQSPSQSFKQKSQKTSSSTGPRVLHRPMPGQGMMCFKCGEGHRANECNWSGVCNGCLKSGHMERVCKSNPASIIKWQTVSSQAESSSAPTSSHGSVQAMKNVNPPYPYATWGPPPQGYYWPPTFAVPPNHPAPHVRPSVPQIGSPPAPACQSYYTLPSSSSVGRPDVVAGCNTNPEVVSQHLPRSG